MSDVLSSDELRDSIVLGRHDWNMRHNRPRVRLILDPLAGTTNVFECPICHKSTRTISRFANVMRLDCGFEAEVETENGYRITICVETPCRSTSILHMTDSTLKTHIKYLESLYAR